jgi:hypothetical protein
MPKAERTVPICL